jgi:hypothetical protein
MENLISKVRKYDARTLRYEYLYSRAKREKSWNTYADLSMKATHSLIKWLDAIDELEQWKRTHTL